MTTFLGVYVAVVFVAVHAILGFWLFGKVWRRVIKRIGPAWGNVVLTLGVAALLAQDAIGGFDWTAWVGVPCLLLAVGVTITGFLPRAGDTEERAP